MKTIKFENTYLNDFYLMCGKDEKKNLKNVNHVINDSYYLENTFEQAEIKMQRLGISKLINKKKMADRNIDVLISGDLSNQITSSTYAAKVFNIPHLGIYSACSTFTESLLIASIFLKTNDFSNILTSVSSHSQVAERQFRFPIEYGNARPMTATVTATGSVASLINHQQSKIKIKSATIGRVVDMGIKDTNHMGAVMAPSCADTLYYHLKNLKKSLSDYDLILTGDLGNVGLDILKEYYYKLHHQKISNIKDAGSILFNNMQDKYAGGSGPCCLPLVFLGKIIYDNRYKKVLLLATGSLHNSILVNQKLSIPSVCHAIEVEVNHDIS